MASNEEAFNFDPFSAEDVIAPDWYLFIEQGNITGLEQMLEGKEMTASSAVKTSKWDVILTAFGYAILKGQHKMVKMLLNHGANLVDVCAHHAELSALSPLNQFTPMGCAISSACPDIVATLLECNPSLALLPCFNDKWIPLEYAVSKHSSRIIPHDPTEQDEAMVEIVRMLISKSANPTKESKCGRFTPLGMVVQKGSIKLLRAVLPAVSKEAATTKVCFVTSSKKEYTPLALARAHGYDDIAKELQQHMQIKE